LWSRHPDAKEVFQGHPIEHLAGHLADEAHVGRARSVPLKGQKILGDQIQFEDVSESAKKKVS